MSVSKLPLPKIPRLGKAKFVPRTEAVGLLVSDPLHWLAILQYISKDFLSPVQFII